MSLNREQGLALGVLVVSGALVGWWWSDSYQKAPAPRGKTVKLPDAPQVFDIVFPDVKDGRYDPRKRDFFIPPFDWNPLPPLNVELFPLPEIGAVGPLLFPAPAPLNWTRLRQPPHIAALSSTADDAAPNVLDASDAPGGAGAAGTAGATGDPNGGANGGASPAVASEGAKGSDPKAKGELDDQAASRRFDWICFKNEKRTYGRILNKDRMALLDDPNLVIQFESVDPRTGKVFITDKIGRDRLTSSEIGQGFGFANTAANRVLLREHDAQGAKTSAIGYLVAARECLKWREEDPKAVLAAADRLVSKSIALDAHAVDPWDLKAELRTLAHDTEGEIAVLDAARDGGVDEPKLMARRARVLRKLGLMSSAADLLQHAIQLNALDASALRELGHLRLDQGDAKAAADAFDRAGKLNSVTPELRQELRVDFARALLYGGDLNGAYQAADSVVKGGMATQTGVASPTDAAAYVMRGVAQYLLGKRAEAMSDMKSALDIDPKNRDAVYDLGVLLALAGDREGANARFREADELDPLRGFDTACARGCLAELGGDLEAAAEYYTRALALHPDHPFGMYRLGRLARRNENQEIAAGALLRALLEIGDMIDVLNELGYVALQSDNFEDAEKYFSESLRREPGQVAVRTLLGVALIRQNRIGDAKSEFTTAASDSDPTALTGVAYCAYKEGDVDDALGKLSASMGAAKSDKGPGGGATSGIFRYADQLSRRIADHREKEQWIDVFDREQIKNDWDTAEAAGPKIEIEKGRILIRGAIHPTESDERTEMIRRVDGKLLVLGEATIKAGPTNAGIHGIRVYSEKTQAAAGGQRVERAFSEIAVALFPDKTVRVYVLDQDYNQVSHNWTTILDLNKEKAAPPDPSRPDVGHKFSIERVNYDTAKFLVRFDDRTLTIPDVATPGDVKPAASAGEPTSVPAGRTEVVVAGLRKTKQPLKFAVFGSGSARENLDLEVDSVRIVRYKPN